MAFVSEQVFGGDFAILENQFSGIAGAQSKLVFLFAELEAGRSLLDHESREAMMAVSLGRLVGDGENHAHVGVVAVGAESLGSVQHPLVFHPHGRAARAAGIGAGAGFGERPGADEVAGRQPGNVLPLLLLVAGDKDVVGAERGVRGHDDANRAVDARKLLDGHGIFDVAHARAAVFDREDRSHEPEPPEFLDCLKRETRGFVPLHHVRRDFTLGELADHLAKVLLLFGKLEIQGLLQGCYE